MTVIVPRLARGASRSFTPARLLTNASNLTADVVDLFLDSMSLLMTPVTPFFLWRPQLRDLADEHVLEAGVNGYVDAIVTFNLRHFRTAAARFGIATLKPGEALQRLGTWQL